ncbi:MAG: methionine adenosyltransferase [Alphaproteobacteria bacterium]
MSKYLFTSESVSEGHPDKICDRISDEILDLCLRKDPMAKVACETLATTNHITLAGEIKGQGITNEAGEILPEVKTEMEEVVRSAVKEIGYEQDGFHWENLTLDNRLHGQSPDINQGVVADAGAFKEEGAGDQGIMFGYATNETENFMPPAIYYSHKILQELSNIRRSPKNPGFGPDMKSQVTLEFENHKAVGVGNVVVSTQHAEDFAQEDIRKVVAEVVNSVLPWEVKDENLFVNPTGKFVIGGPDGDAGLTGRKIIVDTYGGSAPHGGGAFSGKDPTKVDRSAAYVARYVAKNIVAAGFADQCLIQLSYAIGVAKPMSIFVDTFGTGKVSEDKLVSAIEKSIDLTPYGIRTHLQLNRPIYAITSAYGHFGRTATNHGHFPWEGLTLVDELKKNIG